MQMLQYAKLQTEPDVVFISSKIDGPFLEACKQATAGSQEPQYTVLQERQSLFTPDKVSDEASSASHALNACLTTVKRLPRSRACTEGLAAGKCKLDGNT
jgi:hypothetical protein